MNISLKEKFSTITITITMGDLLKSITGRSITTK